MAFVRTVKRENPFVQLDKYFIEDPYLSWEAKGLLAYMLSRPDNWKINQKDLKKRSTGGQSKVETALLELMANGYANWFPIKKEDGTVEEWAYDIYERPEYNPYKDYCIEEGTKRITKRKERNKKKNDKRLGKAPELDNPNVEETPQLDNPHLDNPHLDEPHLDNQDNNNTEINYNNTTNIKDNNNLNLNLIYDTLWNTSLPMNLKQWIKVKVTYKSLVINSEQLLLIDEAYKHQIEKGFIIPDCDKQYQGAINDWEFTGSISKMLDTVKDIQNVRGLVQTWVYKAWEFKATNLQKLSYEQEIPFYDWLQGATT